MKLFYQPTAGDRVRIRKTSLIGTVTRAGTKCHVDVGEGEVLVMDYYRLTPLEPGKVYRKKINKTLTRIKKKINEVYYKF